MLLVAQLFKLSISVLPQLLPPTFFFSHSVLPDRAGIIALTTDPGRAPAGPSSGPVDRAPGNNSGSGFAGKESWLTWAVLGLSTERKAYRLRRQAPAVIERLEDTRHCCQVGVNVASACLGRLGCFVLLQGLLAAVAAAANEPRLRGPASYTSSVFKRGNLSVNDYIRSAKRLGMQIGTQALYSR